MRQRQKGVTTSKIYYEYNTLTTMNKKESNSTLNKVNIPVIKTSHQDAFAHIQSSSKSDWYIAEIDRRCQEVAIRAMVVWLLLSAIAYFIGFQTGKIERLTGVERRAPMAASMLLGSSVLSNLLPRLYRWGQGMKLTGVITAGLIVQFVAFTTDVTLCTMPVPVFIDPITGARVFGLRWCEWTPLAFVMTFMTEACKVESDYEILKPTSTFAKISDDYDSSIDKNDDEYNVDTDSATHTSTAPATNTTTQSVDTSWAYFLAMCQALSTFCGFLFPHINNKSLWILTMIISCILFLVIYYRLYKRYQSFQLMSMGSSVGEQEMYHWARLSLGLLTTCTALWTLLVVAYFVYSIGPLVMTQHNFLTTRGIVMVCECSIDVLFKSIYMLLIVDIHKFIFDPNTRAQRRFEELREMMNVVWKNSSDVIGFSIQKSNGDVMTILSPTFLKLYTDNWGNLSDNDNAEVAKDQTQKSSSSNKGASFELDAKYFKNNPSVNDDDNNNNKNEKNKKDNKKFNRKIIPKCIYDVDFGMSFNAQELRNISTHGTTTSSIAKESDEQAKEVLQPISELIVKAWHSKNESMLLHDFESEKDGQKQTIRCEANITRIEENAIVIVVRNVSERFHRFEAEKKVVQETTARIKDEAANRFTRHEVKNGLLSAIAITDNLKENIFALTSKVQFDVDNDLQKGDDHVKRTVLELDNTLHEILDIVLAEAMARDVIHEVYEPKLERVDVAQLIANILNSTVSTDIAKRFPIVTEPSPLPDMAIDPQLLKYIHRNAMSNACKYGKIGGVVRTEIRWDEKKGVLEMNVINLPGKNHEEVLKLGKQATDIIFSPSKRLHIHSLNENQISTHSAGDGAWVMFQCAKTLGGNCNIEFFDDKTVFSFHCPVTLGTDLISKRSKLIQNFKLPNNMYAIALDDSKIQRKLLDRYFTIAGIPKDRVRILGGTAEEIKTFDEWAYNFILKHPDDYILFIVDENLDVHDYDITTAKEGTISGSRCVSKFRRRLSSDQESRILTLIRSANDSSNDIAMYTSRAHGFLRKAPIKASRALEELAPLWLDRFSFVTNDIKRMGSGIFHPRLGTDGGELATMARDLLESVAEIDTIISYNKQNSLANNWIIIWEKLHGLKGDLLTLPNENTQKFSTIIESISSMRGSTMPSDLEDKWRFIYNQINSTFA